MSYQFRDYSKRFLDYNQENKDIVPFIIAFGVTSDQREKFLDMLYVPQGQTCQEYEDIDNTFINYGKEYVKKYTDEANKKYNLIRKRWKVAEEMTVKAKKSSTFLSITISILTIAAIAISFI